MNATDEAACILGLDTRTLSAARDELLPPDQLQRVRAHVPTCPSCQARVASFDAVAHALRAQRELESGHRILRAVQTHMAQQTSSPSARRLGRHIPAVLARTRLWGGLAALSAVAAILLLFVYVLGGGFMPRGRPSARATPVRTAALTSTPGATPTALSTTPVISVQRAWGDGGVAARFSTQLDATHIFQADAITPDGHTLLGLLFNVASDGSLISPSQVQAGMLEVTTQQFTPFGVAASGNYPPTYVTNDGRFVIVSDDTQPGATCGMCHRRYWSYDLTSHQLRQIGVGVGLTSVAHGVAILADLTVQSPKIVAYDLATGASNQIATGGESLYPVLLGFSWPYVFYRLWPSGAASSPYPVRIFDVRSGAAGQLSASASSLLSGGDSVPLAVVGDSLIFALVTSSVTIRSGSAGSAVAPVRAFSSCPQCTPTPGSPAPTYASHMTVYTLDHVLDPAAQPRQVASITTGSGDAIGLYAAGDTVFVTDVPDSSMLGNANRVPALYALSHATSPAAQTFSLLASNPQLGSVAVANGRLVTFAGMLVYDLTERQLVGLAASSSLASGLPTPITDLAGNFLLVAQSTSRNVPSAEQVTIYDTTRLAVTSG